MRKYRFTRSSEYCIISVSADDFATADILAYLPGARPVQAAPGNTTDIVIGGDGVPYTIPYTAVDWENCDPIVNPATVTNRTTAMATIAGQFVKDAAAGGGGGGSVTVTNLPDNYPDGQVHTDLVATNAALGTPGTHETTNFPDSGLFGTALRKLVYWLYQGQVSIQSTLNPMNVDTAAIKIASQSIDSKLSGAIKTRDTNYDPVTVGGQAWGASSVPGGAIDVADCEGVLYSFSASGNSGGGSFSAQFSNDGATWQNTFLYFWGATQETATYTTAVAAANLNSAGNQVHIPALAKYVRLFCSAGSVTTASFTVVKMARKPTQIERLINGIISIAAAQTIGIVSLSSSGFSVSAVTTYTLASSIGVMYGGIAFQFFKNTASAFTATIEGTIDGTNYVFVDNFVLADFTANEIVKKYKEFPFQGWRLIVTAITGAVTYRGYRAHF